ncbi:tRNA-specific adenosine deaminase 2 [Condylostylus longicornis]|uniref:tRNA-specific adenosine deaminase 2 n=1 Tax=Condylostylus longicornis TaxID=2530218 RepID=UPI00244DCF03|nr:tRNA-specific adenosine deaminase 2 [Condylostylus longicornis]
MENFMENALFEACRAQSNGEVPVGCVFVYELNIIARGGNLVNATKNATRHAEFVCIDQAYAFCEKNNLDYKDFFEKVSVIVTVEPCIMCAAALYNLNVKEIIYGCKNDRFGGTTVLDVSKIMKANITTKGGVRADEAMELLKNFYKGGNPSAPSPKRKVQST